MTNPPGFYPFWFWNDRLSADEICWQVAEMAAQGIRGFFIHPRQGLQEPYLSDAVFAMVAVVIYCSDQHKPHLQSDVCSSDLCGLAFPLDAFITSPTK